MKESGSISTTLLLITFLVLKLTGVIDWSWWWVLAPAWIPLAFGIIVITYLFIDKNKEK